MIQRYLAPEKVKTHITFSQHVEEQDNRAHNEEKSHSTKPPRTHINGKVCRKENLSRHYNYIAYVKLNRDMKDIFKVPSCTS